MDGERQTLDWSGRVLHIRQQRTKIAARRMWRRAVGAAIFAALGLCAVFFPASRAAVSPVMMLGAFGVAAIWLVLFFDAHEHWNNSRQS